MRFSITIGNRVKCLEHLHPMGGGIRGDTPLILMVKDESIPNDNRSVMCEQPSRELHRAGCVQRYAPGDREEQ